MCVFQGLNSDLTYKIMGNEQALKYLVINPLTGDIALSQSLEDAGINNFNVRKLMCSVLLHMWFVFLVFCDNNIILNSAKCQLDWLRHKSHYLSRYCIFLHSNR